MTGKLGTLNPLTLIREDKAFFSGLLALALPLALQNLVATSVNMLDTFMIGQLGESAIAAVALSNQIFFLQMLLLFGISSGSAVFTAQYWGKKDLQGLYNTSGIAFVLGLSSAVLFTAACQILPEEILRIFSTDEDVIRQAIPYLRITSASYLFTSVTIVQSSVLRTTGEARIPLVISLGALSLNALFNYFLIFGKAGFPRMGATGAALATSLARTLEMIVLLAVIYGKKHPAAFHIKKMGHLTGDFLRNFFNRLYPVVLNEIGWSMGITVFTVVYARMGTEVLAAYNITDTVTRFAFVLFMGTGNGAAVVMGNRIGGGEDREHLNRYARKILYLAPLMGTIFAVLFMLMAPLIPMAFKVGPEAQGLITQFLRVMSLVLLFKISNMQIIVGILRSGGDTHYCATLELIPLWLIAIPLMAVTGLVLHWDPVLVYLVAMSEEAIKYFIGLQRVVSGKWIHNVT